MTLSKYAQISAAPACEYMPAFGPSGSIDSSPSGSELTP